MDLLSKTVAAWIPAGWKYGGLARHSVVSASNVVQVSSRDLVWAVEPLGRVVRACIETAPPTGPLAHSESHPGGLEATAEPRHVVVFGAGTMGLLATLLATLEQPASLTVVGRGEKSLARAGACGATHLIDIANFADDLAVIEEVRGITPARRGADVVFQAIGVFDRALEALCETGMVCMLNWLPGLVAPGQAQQDPIAKLIPDAGVLSAMRLAARLLDTPVTEGGIDPSPMVEAVLPLSDIQNAFETAAADDAGKVIVDSAQG